MTGAPPLIRVAGLTWVPPTASRPVLDGIDLEIAAGERVLLAGPSGSGKSSLLRALAGLVETGPDGASGTVTVDGRPPQQVPGTVGLLTQDPADSVVAVSTGRDLAFGPENLGLPVAAVGERVRAALAAVRFPYGAHRRTSALSGGERQRLALAGLLALEPRLLLLDEPLAMLDPAAADTVHAAVLAVAAGRRTGFVVVDHHLDRWWHDVDRLVVLGAGGVVLADGSPDGVLAAHRQTLAAAGLWVPDEPWLPGGAVRLPGSGRGAPVLSADDVGMLAPGPLVRGGVRRGSFSSGPVWAVRGASASLSPGSVTALTGPSGIGKSTLLTALAALAVPAAGSVAAAPQLAGALGPAPDRWRSRELAARISWTPQDPTAGFVRTTVTGEVEVGPAAVGRPLAPGRAEQLLASAGLSGRGAADPRRLSGGEQRRLAVVAALAARAPVLLLDEPTVGQDRATWSTLVRLIGQACAAGVAVGIATHDQRLVAALADTTVELTGARRTAA